MTFLRGQWADRLPVFSHTVEIEIGIDWDQESVLSCSSDTATGRATSPTSGRATGLSKINPCFVVVALIQCEGDVRFDGREDNACREDRGDRTNNR